MEKSAGEIHTKKNEVSSKTTQATIPVLRPSLNDYLLIMMANERKTTALKTRSLCGKLLQDGKRCQNDHVADGVNAGCSEHYGWQDKIEGFRLRTF